MTAEPASGRTRTVTLPPRGVCAIPLSTRIVTSWRRRSASPSTSVGRGSTAREMPRPAAMAFSGATASTATSARSSGARSSSGAGVGPGQQELVLGPGRQVARLCVEVHERVTTRATVSHPVLRSPSRRPDHVSGSAALAGVWQANSRWRRRAASAARSSPDRGPGRGRRRPSRRRTARAMAARPPRTRTRAEHRGVAARRSRSPTTCTTFVPSQRSTPRSRPGSACPRRRPRGPSLPRVRAASTDDWTGRPSTTSSPPRTVPSGATARASVPEASPPKASPRGPRSVSGPGRATMRATAVARLFRVSVARPASSPETAA